HRAPRRREPQAHRGDEIDHGKEDGRGLPLRGVSEEPAILAADEAAHRRPMIEALEHRYAGHDAQKQHQPFGPGAFPAPLVAGVNGRELVDRVAGDRIGHWVSFVGWVERERNPSLCHVARWVSLPLNPSYGSYGSISSRASGAKWRSTSASVTSPSE